MLQLLADNNIYSLNCQYQSKEHLRITNGTYFLRVPTRRSNNFTSTLDKHETQNNRGVRIRTRECSPLAYGSCADSDGQRDGNRKETSRRIRPWSHCGGQASVAAALASCVRAATHLTRCLVAPRTDRRVVAATVTRPRQ